MKNKLYLTLAVILAWFFGFSLLSAVSASEANIYFEVNEFNPDSAGEVVIDILLDSLPAVNAYDLVFKYPENLLDLKYANMANSIIDVVPEQISGDEFGQIAIRGGGTKAFSGERGLVARLHFKAKAIGGSNLGFISARIHLADGSGVAIEPNAYHAKEFEIRGLERVIKDESIIIPLGEEDQIKKDFADGIKPKILTMKIIKDPFDKTNSLLVFEAKDSESGILHYLIREKKWILFGVQNRVNNPHSITPGAWAIELVVVDNFGNEVKRTVYRWSALTWKLLFILLLFIGLWAVIKMYKSWHRAQRIKVVN